MIPVLYPNTETKFETLGMGLLVDATKCVVTEELNGIFELHMTYPEGGQHCENLLAGNLIYASHDDTGKPQPFDIYNVTRQDGGEITVSAQHISYRLSSVPVKPFSAWYPWPAMQALAENVVMQTLFQFHTDLSMIKHFSIKKPTSVRSVLASENGMANAYGGDLQWDHFQVRLLEQRGADNGVVVAYGKNLQSAQQEANLRDLLTGIYPFYSKDGVYVDLLEQVLTLSNSYGYPRIQAVDLTGEFSEGAPTQSLLRQKANDYIKANAIREPKVNITANFIPLWQTDEYRELAPLEKVLLGDWVTVRFASLNAAPKARVTRTVYNTLLDRYDSVTLGNPTENAATLLAKIVKGLKDHGS